MRGPEGRGKGMHDSAAGREIGQGNRRGRHCKAASPAGTMAGCWCRAVGRGATRVWQWLGPRGRLVALLPLADSIGKTAGDIHVLPDREPWTGSLSLAVVAFAIGGLMWLRVRGQRATERGQQEWQDRTHAGKLIQGGWRDYAHSHEAKAQQGLARLTALEGEVAALKMGLTRAGAAAGRTDLVAPEQETGRAGLYVVRDQRGA